MRILLYSPAFHPLVGGLETVVEILADRLARRGVEVVVVTTTPGSDVDTFPFRIVRRPGPAELLRWVRWSDFFFQANVSLRGLWPLVLVRRPWVVSHHGSYKRTDGRIAWQDRLKRHLLRYATASIAISRAVAADMDVSSLVIPNPYRDELFRPLPDVPRDRDLLFVGRLVSVKGADLLLDALALLAADGLRPQLTIAGEGPERRRLEEQAERLGLAGQVSFVGVVTGEPLVLLLNQHRTLVVPSRYDEPFGIVALEGIACGCAVVGSAGGGLAEAIGLCGRTFPNCDVPALARILAELLRDPAERHALLHDAPAHLARHTGARVAEDIFGVLQRAAHRSASETRGGRIMSDSGGGES